MVRFLLVEAAQTASIYDPELQGDYQRLKVLIQELADRSVFFFKALFGKFSSLINQKCCRRSPHVSLEGDHVRAAQRWGAWL
jgi:hypothetical protein